MPRNYAQLLLTIWADPDWRQLPHTSQWAYELLISQEAINYAGVQPLTIRRWTNLAVDMDEPTIWLALKTLDERTFVAVDEDTEEILVRSFIRNDGVARSPNMLKAALRSAQQVVSPRLRSVLLDELQRVDVSTMRVQVGHKPVQPLYAETIEALTSGPNPPPPGTRTVHPLEGHGEGFREGFREPIGEPLSTGTGTSLPTELLSSRPPVCVARTHAKPPSAAELNASAATPDVRRVIDRWRDGHQTQYRAATYRALAKQIRDTLPGDAHPDLILDALHRWDERDNASPGLLPHLYDDAVRATRERRATPTTGRRNGPATADDKIAALMALKTGTDGAPAPLRAIEGGLR